MNKLIENKNIDNIKRDLNQSPGAASKGSSLFTEESEVNEPYKLRQQGLIGLSFEGNTLISDRGAASIAMLIQNQNAFSNNLKTVNLNECGITNVGFDYLK